ncbi:hypothetical protein BCS95_15010 [Vibrio breoganii]|uniref:flippase n=1 Tax=Vibrio breoganii TaxID=553239 RepID=UPI000C837FBC|nr:flippase [Vibrio breoganii]PMP01114.1 hypothetical protein BCS95_15010 [Vibrio breoganii]
MFNLSNTFKIFFNNATWLIVGKFYRVLLVTITTVYVSRYLGPEEFGILNYALSIVIIFSFIVGVGLESIVTKEVCQPKAYYGRVLLSSIFLRVIGWIVFISFLTLFCFFIKPNDDEFFKYIMILSLGYSFKILEIFRFFFEAKVMGRLVTILEIIAITISCVFKFYFVYQDYSLDYFFFASILDILLLSVFLTVEYFRYRRGKSKEHYRLEFDYSKVKQLFSQSWPLIFAGGLFLVYSKIDQVMLGELSGMHSVGVYAAAVKLSEGGGFIFTSLAVAVYPLMLREKNVSQEKFIKKTEILLCISMALSIILAIFITLVATPLSHFVFGDEYVGVDTVLSIHVWGAIFIGINAISHRYLIVEGLQKHAAYKSVIGILVNVVLNYFLIPKYGVNGAAWATVISHFFSTYIYFSFSKDTMVLFKMKSYVLSLLWMRDVIKISFRTLKSKI